jgi:hypothetical protein
VLRARRTARPGWREAAKAPIKVHKLRGNVSILEDSRCNIAVLTGSDGKVCVDAGILG